MTYKLTEEQRTKAVAMYADGVEKTEYIAYLFGIRREYLARLAVRRGVPLRMPRKAKAQREARQQ